MICQSSSIFSPNSSYNKTLHKLTIKSMWIFEKVWSFWKMLNTWSDFSVYVCVCMCLLLQAHMLVCRALSNMLLLPWPNLPENEQQWQTRSSNHTSLLAALTREYRILRGTVNIPPRQPDLNNSQYLFFFYYCFVTFGLLFSLYWFHFPALSCPAKCVFWPPFFYSSESSDTADPACAQRPSGQHLWGIHQITSDLLPESSGVCPSVPQPFPSVYSAVRSVSHIPFGYPSMKFVKNVSSMKLVRSIYSVSCTYLSRHTGGTNTHTSIYSTGKTCRYPTSASMMITLHVTKDQINIIIQSRHFSVLTWWLFHTLRCSNRNRFNKKQFYVPSSVQNYPLFAQK